MIIFHLIPNSDQGISNSLGWHQESCEFGFFNFESYLYVWVTLGLKRREKMWNKNEEIWKKKMNNVSDFPPLKIEDH